MIDELILKRTEYTKHSVVVADDDLIIKQVISYYSERGWDYGDTTCWDVIDGVRTVNLHFTKDIWEEELINGKLEWERLGYED